MGSGFGAPLISERIPLDGIQKAFLTVSSLGRELPNLNTSAPRNEQAGTAIPAQTWRRLGV
jgi:hypothetical protein